MEYRNVKKYYLVPAEIIESNFPDDFINGTESACKVLGAKMFLTGWPLEEIKLVPQHGLDAIREAIEKY